MDHSPSPVRSGPVRSASADAAPVWRCRSFCPVYRAPRSLPGLKFPAQSEVVFLSRFDTIYGMRVYTCRKCGKQYETAGFTDGLCDECLMEHLDKYHQVREYLWSHPGSTASEIATACECSVRQVMQWVKEDRFMLTDGSKVLLYCANCGAKITSGVYCAACKALAEKNQLAASQAERMIQRLNNMHGVSMNHPQPKDGKMRFLSGDDKKR